MFHPLSIGLLVCVLSLCHAQYMGMPPAQRGGYSQYDGFRSTYPRGGSSGIYDAGPSYRRDQTYGDSSRGFDRLYMGGSGRDIDMYSTGQRTGFDRSYMGGSGRDIDRYGNSQRTSLRGSYDRSGYIDSRDGRRAGGGGGPPREGYIGARGGQAGFPVHGGYCAGEMCRDGGVAVGMGRGHGAGAEQAMDQRVRTGQNEDISMYEMFSGGPSSMPGGMAGPMMGGSPPMHGMPSFGRPF